MSWKVRSKKLFIRWAKSQKLGPRKQDIMSKELPNIRALLAMKYGLSEQEAEIIRLATPMHDVAKLASQMRFSINRAHSRVKNSKS